MVRDTYTHAVATVSTAEYSTYSTAVGTFVLIILYCMLLLLLLSAVVCVCVPAELALSWHTFEDGAIYVHGLYWACSVRLDVLLPATTTSYHAVLFFLQSEQKQDRAAGTTRRATMDKGKYTE